MAGLHSRFAPSSAHRVMTCPGSLLASEGAPDFPSYEAVEGTVGHWLHERWLIDGTRPDRFLGQRPWSFMDHAELTPAEWQILRYEIGTERDLIVDDTMLSHLEESVMRCLEIPGERYVEQRVDISPWCPAIDENGDPVPPQKGTADFFTCRPGVLDITDLKYGMGVMVFAERNYQAIKYALGVINEYDWLYDFEKIYIRINQPRLNHYDVWETTKAELLEIGKFIKAQYELALQPNAPFKASDKGCQFCRIKSKCRTLTETVLELFDFEDDATPDDVRTEAAFISEERQVEIYQRRALYKLWIGAIEGEIERRLKADPKSVPGLKLVNGRSIRVWRKPDEALDELRFAGVPEEKLFKPAEMISPAQAEEVFKGKAKKELKAVIAELVDKPLGAPLIANADDPRPDYVADNTAAANKHFDEEDEFDD